MSKFLSRFAAIFLVVGSLAGLGMQKAATAEVATLEKPATAEIPASVFNDPTQSGARQKICIYSNAKHKETDDSSAYKTYP